MAALQTYSNDALDSFVTEKSTLTKVVTRPRFPDFHFLFQPGSGVYRDLFGERKVLRYGGSYFEWHTYM